MFKSARDLPITSTAKLRGEWSTLLLAVLCVLLVAPTSQANAVPSHAQAAFSREVLLCALEQTELSTSLLQQVLRPQAGSGNQLSTLEVQQVRALLTQLEQRTRDHFDSASPNQTNHGALHATATEYSAARATWPALPEILAPQSRFVSLPSHLAAQLSGVRNNRFHE